VRQREWRTSVAEITDQNTDGGGGDKDDDDLNL
jgi:hypothetical protein